MKKTVAAGELDAPYQVVFGDVAKIVDAARDSATRSVNAAMTAAYWLIGHRIVEFEQSGEERATYGTALMERLAADLTQRFGRGFSRQNIQYMRLFYVSYPSDQIRQALSGKLTRSTQRLPLNYAWESFSRPFRCPGPPTCGCSRSRTPAPVNSMEQRRCEEGGRFASSTGRSIPSSTSAPPCRRTRPPC